MTEIPAGTSQVRTPAGELRNIPLADQVFTRALSMAGTRSSVPEQRRKLRVGNHVKVGGSAGVLVYMVAAVSRDKLTWRDEDGRERHTCDILL